MLDEGAQIEEVSVRSLTPPHNREPYDTQLSDAMVTHPCFEPKWDGALIDTPARCALAITA